MGPNVCRAPDACLIQTPVTASWLPLLSWSLSPPCLVPAWESLGILEEKERDQRAFTPWSEPEAGGPR